MKHKASWILAIVLVIAGCVLVIALTALAVNHEYFHQNQPSVGSFVSPSKTAETGSSPYISDVQLICISPTVTGLPSEYTSSLESVMPAAS